MPPCDHTGRRLGRAKSQCCDSLEDHAEDELIRMYPEEFERLVNEHRAKLDLEPVDELHMQRVLRRGLGANR